MTEVTYSASTSIFRMPYILLNRKQPAEIKGTKPTESEQSVLDPKTFDAVEVDALFEGMNRAETQIGQAILYRSLAQPTHHAEVLQKKQEALRELAMNPALLNAYEQFIKKMADGEETLYHLLYGEFSGGFTTDHPKNKVGKLEFGGYGYRQFIDGTEFAIDLVEETRELPPVQSSYLQELIQAIRDFGDSRTYALMHGPFYVIDGKFKTKDEKPSYWPIPRFRPSMFKWLPTLIFVLIVSGLLYFFESMLVELGANYIGYGILILTVPIFPIIVQAVSSSDRNSVIYPLQKLFRQSPELIKAMEALGMIDELLSLHRYAKASHHEMILPEIVTAGQHTLTAMQAKNPLLMNTNAHYVANDVKLDAANRLLIITGPNS